MTIENFERKNKKTLQMNWKRFYFNVKDYLAEAMCDINMFFS